jgi:hypothetical protein
MNLRQFHILEVIIRSNDCVIHHYAPTGPTHVEAFVYYIIIVIIKKFVRLVGLRCIKYSLLLEAELITPTKKA